MDPVRVFAETENRIHTDHEDLVTAHAALPRRDYWYAGNQLAYTNQG